MPDYSFQQKAVDLVVSGTGPTLLQAPTGAGKTRMAMSIARRLPGPTLFVAESREIIKQTMETAQRAGFRAFPLTANTRTDRKQMENVHKMGVDFVAASQKTAWSRAGRGHNLGDYPTIIVDEAHHVRARTYQELLANWPNARLILMTATPIRSDGKGLGDVADTLVQGRDYGGSYSDLTKAEVLVPCGPENVWTWPKDLSRVKTLAGDYAMGGERGAANLMDVPKIAGDVVSHWIELACDRKTICYTSSVGHAENLMHSFQLEGVEARMISATTPKEERDTILCELRDGDVQVVTNYGVLTEGFDCPNVSCIVLARPTKHLGTYLQMVGRGLRSSTGKDNLLLLDHVGNVVTHGLPGTDIVWALEGDKGRVGEAEKKKKVRPCPRCAQVLNEKRRCNNCGWGPVPSPKTSADRQQTKEWEDMSYQDDVNLMQLSSERVAEIKQVQTSPKRAEYQRLKKLVVDRGLKPGFAAMQFKEQYDEWPPTVWDLPDPTKVEPFEFLEAARQLAADKGWKPGFAAYCFKEQYGDWPPYDSRTPAVAKVSEEVPAAPETPAEEEIPF